MTTAAQLITYLQTLPPETPIEVLREVTRGYETYTKWIPLQIPTQEQPYPNECNLFCDTLQLGEM